MFAEGEQEAAWLKDAGFPHLATNFEGTYCNIITSYSFDYDSEPYQDPVPGMRSQYPHINMSICLTWALDVISQSVRVIVHV